MRRKILPLFFIFLTHLLFAQHTGRVRLYVSPPNAWVRLDTLVFDLKGKTQPLEITVRAGEHTICVWAPGLQPSEETVVVTADSVLTYKKGLRQMDPGYDAFRTASAKYNKERIFKGATLGVLLLADAAVLYGVFEKNKINAYREDALEYKAGYEKAIAPEHIADFKKNFDISVDKYQKAQKAQNWQLAVGIPAATALTGFTVWYFRKMRKNKPEKPVFEFRNPFLPNGHTSMGPVFGPGSIGLTINF